MWTFELPKFCVLDKHESRLYSRLIAVHDLRLIRNSSTISSIHSFFINTHKTPNETTAKLLAKLEKLDPNTIVKLCRLDEELLIICSDIIFYDYWNSCINRAGLISQHPTISDYNLVAGLAFYMHAQQNLSNKEIIDLNGEGVKTLVVGALDYCSFHCYELLAEIIQENIYYYVNSCDLSNIANRRLIEISEMLASALANRETINHHGALNFAAILSFFKPVLAHGSVGYTLMAYLSFWFARYCIFAHNEALNPTFTRQIVKNIYCACSHQVKELSANAFINAWFQRPHNRDSAFFNILALVEQGRDPLFFINRLDSLASTSAMDIELGISDGSNMIREHIALTSTLAEQSMTCTTTSSMSNV